jgi:hypothetical protein
MGRPIAMIVATMPSMRSVLLSLAGLRLLAGSWATVTLAAIQRVKWASPPATEGAVAQRADEATRQATEAADTAASAASSASIRAFVEFVLGACAAATGGGRRHGNECSLRTRLVDAEHHSDYCRRAGTATLVAEGDRGSSDHTAASVTLLTLQPLVR